MFEKVNPCHPDKVADRIAGAVVDYAYTQERNPRIAVEVLIGHGECFIIAETSVSVPQSVVEDTVERIAGLTKVTYLEQSPDAQLAGNQKGKIRCGDNGIFRGMPITPEQKQLCTVAKDIYDVYRTDGKYILDGEKLVICQSNARTELLKRAYPTATVNPLGDWTGGLNVDTGATNRKLGSDMGDGVTGGGLHGKDLSKADVSVNIYAHMRAQETGCPMEYSCAIGDTEISGIPYQEIVETARHYIRAVGGFEKFAEWGLIK
ncbi:MAG: hypothetical protein II861_01405 [Methanomicrobium sp.]|nr:hypothetical protein [Methanomicrobium sp.]